MDNDKTVKEQAIDFGNKVITWIKDHPKDTIIVCLVCIILIII